MLNIGPGELIVIALVLLIAVGPEQLPGLIRRIGQVVGQARDMTDSLRTEFMSGMEEIERATDPNAWAASAGPSRDESKPIVPLIEGQEEFIDRPGRADRDREDDQPQDDVDDDLQDDVDDQPSDDVDDDLQDRAADDPSGDVADDPEDHAADDPSGDVADDPEDHAADDPDDHAADDPDDHAADDPQDSGSEVPGDRVDDAPRDAVDSTPASGTKAAPEDPRAAGAAAFNGRNGSGLTGGEDNPQMEEPA